MKNRFKTLSILLGATVTQTGIINAAEENPYTTIGISKRSIIECNYKDVRTQVLGLNVLMSNPNYSKDVSRFFTHKTLITSFPFCNENSKDKQILTEKIKALSNGSSIMPNMEDFCRRELVTLNHFVASTDAFLAKERALRIMCDLFNRRLKCSFDAIEDYDYAAERMNCEISQSYYHPGHTNEDSRPDNQYSIKIDIPSKDLIVRHQTIVEQFFTNLKKEQAWFESIFLHFNPISFGVFYMPDDMYMLQTGDIQKLLNGSFSEDKNTFYTEVGYQIKFTA